MAGVMDSVNQRTQLVGQNRLELLLFRLNSNQLYGINVFKVKEVLQRLGQDVDPSALVKDLSISTQQLIEIAKALTLDCKVLILDEPTAALTDNESAALFKVLHDLKAQGIGIIYISHRMAEIFAHCSRVTVLRDGRDVHSGPLAELDADGLVRRMVGRDLGNYYPPKQDEPASGEHVLEVTDIADGERVHGVSFRLKRVAELGPQRGLGVAVEDGRNFGLRVHVEGWPMA